MQKLESRLESLKTLILCEVPVQENPFTTPFSYVLGDFSIANLPIYPNLSEVIDAINPHGEVSIGIGFDTYCQNIRDAIYECQISGKRATFMLPLWDEVITHNFIMTVSKNNGVLSLLFIYFGDQSLFTNIDQMVADSFKDQLTGLFNRSTMLNHVRENRRDGYLCLFDLNKFKHINDTYGHGAGDEVLVSLAKYLIAISSMEEVYYRRSGDEFMILIFQHDLNYVHDLIQKIEDFLEVIHENDLKSYKGLRCSASFGVLEILYPEGTEGLGTELEFKLVDLAMYQAKAAGVRMHLITYEDAKRIIANGDLDERLKTLAASIRR